jgi:hypothetical protein
VLTVEQSNSMSVHSNISVTLRVSLLWFAFISFVQPSLAAIRPAFLLDYCSWHATDVVLVEVTPKPGIFRVMESWNGDLKAGDLVAVPEMQPPTGGMEIVSYPRDFDDIVKGGANEQIPAQHIGSQLVLFLKKSPEASSNHWKSADLFGEMKASAVWMDGGQLYTFRQLMNPGPSVLVPWDMTLDKMKERVSEIHRIELDLVRVTAIEDDAARAEGLKVYVRSDIFEARQLALNELPKSGPKALPAIREMLSDSTFADERAELVKAFAEAGGESVGEELDVRLQEQVRFWQATAPTLSVGWWNQDANPHAPLRERYSQTWQLVLALERVHYPPAVTTAGQLGALWRSLPQLNDPSGLDEMASECEKFVAEFHSN